MISEIYLLQGKHYSAYIELRKETDEGWKLTALGMMYNLPGRKAEASAALQELMTKYQDDWAYQIAQAFAWNGTRDLAFYWLERAYSNRDGGLAEIKGQPFFQEYKKQPPVFCLYEKDGATVIKKSNYL